MKSPGKMTTALHCITGVGASGAQVLPDLVVGEKFILVADKSAYNATVKVLPRATAPTPDSRMA